MSLSVRELMMRMQVRQESRNVCFEKIYDKCCAHIERHANKNSLFCLYQVPEFMLGFPLYDINMCITYVKEKLESNDFLVKYYFPNLLYISWNVNEMQEEKITKDMELLNMFKGTNTTQKPQKRKAPQKRLTFANPPVTTGFIKSVKQFKPSGKLVLNLDK